jgi:hypothetical protein
MPINRAWHEANRMPRNATLAQRVEWHRQHQLNCDCRPAPPSLRAQIEGSAPPPKDRA